MTLEPDPIALDVLEGNIQLLAFKERLEQDKLRLLEIDRHRNEFLARISHDLRTPLNSIIGFSELLMADVGGKLNKKHSDFVAAIHRNGYALLSLITELLDLASLESGQLSLRRDHLALKTILDDLRAATEPQLKAHRLTVAWPDETALDGKTAFVDRRRIAQILTNLVDNARKFTPEGGQISVAMEADTTSARFSVLDTGSGVPEADRERIFQSFFQRHPSSLERGAGVGLGLAIVRGLTDLHGGAIELDSVPGKGSNFRVIIPQV